MREKILKIANDLGVISETDLLKLNDAEKVVIIAMEAAYTKGVKTGIDQASQLIHKIKIKTNEKNKTTTTP